MFKNMIFLMFFNIGTNKVITCSVPYLKVRYVKYVNIRYVMLCHAF